MVRRSNGQKGKVNNVRPFRRLPHSLYNSNFKHFFFHTRREQYFKSFLKLIFNKGFHYHFGDDACQDDDMHHFMATKMSIDKMNWAQGEMYMDVVYKTNKFIYHVEMQKNFTKEFINRLGTY